MNDTAKTMLAYIETLPVIDTHEHLPSFEKFRAQNTDILNEYTIHYMSCDLISAGLSNAELERVRKADMPVTEKWAILAPFWEAARYTGYGQALDIAVQGLYNLPELNADTVEKANEAFVTARAGGNWYRHVLKEKCNIAISIADSWTLDNDPEYFVGAYNINSLICPGSIHEMARQLAAEHLSLTLENWTYLAEKRMMEAFAHGAGVLKCSLAYNRPLFFRQRSAAEAEASLCEALNAAHTFNPNAERVHTAPDVRFEDYMCHWICRFAQQKGWTTQWHTGLQEGNGSVLEYTRPELLTNLFLAYPELRFDLFHISYPYMQVAGALCKNFPNVFLDMCWAHIIAPSVCVRTLYEWLDAVPANKISAFGGDYCFPDAVYGHLTLARRNVAKALALKIADGWPVARAEKIAQWLFYDNPLHIFRLEERLSE